MAESMFSEGARLIVPKDKEAFLEKFGAVFEGSPHFAERFFESFQNESNDDAIVLADEFHQAMFGVVESAAYGEKLKLIQAHPELGADVTSPAMADNSVTEQKGAGLDTVSDGIKVELGQLNNQYQEKFNFPFIIAVGNIKAEDKPAAILTAMKERIKNESDAEFNTALSQIYNIVGIRLAAIAKVDKPNLPTQGFRPS